MVRTVLKASLQADIRRVPLELPDPIEPGAAVAAIDEAVRSVFDHLPANASLQYLYKGEDDAPCTLTEGAWPHFWPAAPASSSP